MSVASILFIITAGVTLLLLLVLKARINAFISLLLTAIFVGILAGMPLKEITNSETRQVRFSEVDQNGHVNNIRYIDWCLDALPSAWHREHRIRSMIINYLSEVRADEALQISSGPGREQSHDIQGTREGDGKVIFRTRFGFEDLRI